MGKRSLRNDLKTNHSAEIGERLKQLRIEYGKSRNETINQEEFGKILGLDVSDGASMQGLVGKLERGDTLISPAELEKYAQTCDVTIDYVVSGKKGEERDADITLKDFCDALVKLDKCGLLHLLNRQNELLVSFGRRDFIFENHYADIDGETAHWNTDGEFDDSDLSPFTDLATFIKTYASIKPLIRETPDIAELALSGALNHVFPISIDSMLKIAQDSLKEAEEKKQKEAEENAFMNIPMDESLPFN